MDVKIANAVGGYLETLYEVNVKLIKLCGMDVMNPYEKDKRLVLDIVEDIFRLFACVFHKEHNKWVVDKAGGLLEFCNTFVFLKKDFSHFLQVNYDFLDSLKRIRNKYEHRMHDVKIVGEGNGSISLFDFDFDIKGEKITVSAKDLIDLLIQLNCIYSKVQKDVLFYAQEQNITEYPYYNRLSRFDFNDFTKIYADVNLRLIGQLMHKF